MADGEAGGGVVASLPKVEDARHGLVRYVVFYHEERPHQALGYRPPAAVYQA